MTGAGWLLAVVLGAHPALDATVGVGGVYDTNLAHAPASASTEDAQVHGVLSPGEGYEQQAACDAA